jgi:hypothetical protein
MKPFIPELAHGDSQTNAVCRDYDKDGSFYGSE